MNIPIQNIQCPKNAKNADIIILPSVSLFEDIRWPWKFSVGECTVVPPYSRLREPPELKHVSFLAALAALCPPLSLSDWLIHGLEFSFRILTKPHQTIPTTYPTYFADPPELPSHLTYPPTWLTYPSVLPTYLICSPVHITSQIG